MLKVSVKRNVISVIIIIERPLYINMALHQSQSVTSSQLLCVHSYSVKYSKFDMDPFNEYSCLYLNKRLYLYKRR